MRYCIFLFLVIALVSCEERKESSILSSKRPVNPNGDSELALLMREMFEESDSLRQLVLDGNQLSNLRRFETIHNAIATDPTVRGPVFEAFSKAYINSIGQLELTDSTTAFNFNRMIDQCMNCHTEFCPGPKRRIKKLYINS